MASPFGPPALWREDDLIGVSRDFDPDLAVAAYASGVFPMPAPGGLMGWYSPLRRGVLPLDGLRVSRSLRKMLGRYEIRTDTAFDAVLAGCADRRRPNGWIDDRIRRVYRQLHRRGIVHSVEAWTAAGELAGGLYGVSIGGLFAGESMFHRPGIGRDASKVALVALVERLRSAGTPDRLLDVQWVTPHLASLGVVEISRGEYLQRLAAALHRPPPAWER
jgi:leucyl/phenylalanyl-tRNA---protein transferase